jgi:AcrR family transcriptional regulator
MTDVCEACSLSRGGVYRHFGSTKEIFIAMLEKDLDDGRVLIDKNIGLGVPAAVILSSYLNQEKEAILGDHNGLYYAIHEFAFHERDMRGYFGNRLKSAIDLMRAVLRHGQENGEFKHFDAAAMAAHIIYFLDSLKTSSIIFAISEEDVDAQINMIKEMIA